MRLSMRRWMTVWKGLATTATSLDVIKIWGDINKTQSKATPNEAGSLGTTSGYGGDCCLILKLLSSSTGRVEEVQNPKADKGKGIMIEDPVVEQVKNMKRLKQIRLVEELAFKLQAEKKGRRKKCPE
ncbi:hypothetical protein Tco_1112583 [Tanacetum coccineum]|uniref:Uncharacterized protein n=1 Tax=Tanacetum coccineum TaxID=301880 RepID=A0ABQ5IR79_9ASTR